MSKDIAYPTSVAELPREPYYAILYPDSVRIPGDERSRTSPGHGYPAHTENFWRIEIYFNEIAWKEAIHALATAEGYAKRLYQAVAVTPARVITSVAVDIE